MAVSSILPSLRLQASAHREEESLVVAYAIANRGHAPVLVLHLDYYMGGPHALLTALQPGTAALFLGTERLPPEIQAAWSPRAAASVLGPGETIHQRVVLGLPLAETGVIAIPPPERSEPSVPVHRLLLLLEVMADEGGRPLPKTMGGGLDVFERKTPHEYSSTWVELPEGSTLSPLPGGISTIAHALPKQ